MAFKFVESPRGARDDAKNITLQIILEHQDADARNSTFKVLCVFPDNQFVAEVAIKEAQPHFTYFVLTDSLGKGNENHLADIQDGLRAIAYVSNASCTVSEAPSLEWLIENNPRG